MFELNKYYKWYMQLCAKRTATPSSDKFHEKHHVIPRSMGGDDSEQNLVYLTLREHLVAHLLLVKCVSGKQQYKMMHALKMMCFTREEIKINSHLYAKMKEKYYSEHYIHIVNPETNETRHLFNNEEIPAGWIIGGAKKSEEMKEKLRTYRTGLARPDLKVNKGKKHWCNTITGETTFCHEKDLIGTGWINPTQSKGKTRGKLWHDPATGETLMFQKDEIPPEGWVKGKFMTEKLKESCQKNVKVMRDKTDVEHLSKIRKDRYPWYDPNTLEEKLFRPNEMPPDEWVRGRSPKNIRSGHKQTDYQKQRVMETHQKTIILSFIDGTVREMKGWKSVCELLGAKKSILEYNIKKGRLSRYNLLDFYIVENT